MNSTPITWSCDYIDDQSLLDQIPPELASVLIRTNGFILHHGIIHFRGAVQSPIWHSLRYAWAGDFAFHRLYSTLHPSDIPFAQDLFGDQFVLRDGKVYTLQAETGDLVEKESSLRQFIQYVDRNPAKYLNASLNVGLRPGELLFAFPPFFVDQGDGKSELKPCPAQEVIRIHAHIAKQVKNLPNGTHIEFKVSKDVAHLRR